MWFESSAATLEPLTGQVNNIDRLLNVHYSAGKLPCRREFDTKHKNSYFIVTVFTYLYFLLFVYNLLDLTYNAH